MARFNFNLGFFGSGGERIALGLLLAALLIESAPTHAAGRPVMGKPAILKKVQRDYCTRLFEREWVAAIGKMGEPVSKNGFKFGVGTKMAVKVDTGKAAEGVFLGRLVDVEYKTTGYLFEDIGEMKNYVIDPERTKILFGGKVVPDSAMQPIVETVEQRGDTCATYSVENYFSQLLAAKREGNGELRKALEGALGHADIRQIADDYYLKTRGGANFDPVFKEIGDKYGYACKTIKFANAAQFTSRVSAAIAGGVPVLLEFYIGKNMVKAEDQWVNTLAKTGEDRRFWPPRALGDRSGGGHALVAVETFQSGSDRLKLLISDSDWNKRPISWDYEKYFESRAKSSGMIAHFCENAK